ncbi:hypothetical protein PAN31117_05394 [Pandoraea anapnoica]|uniref:Uncharacterized protein n=1 Tax=Pandoraea anapnoica TaxID=2508301 RepID=A0A5E5AT13_9BURK|nr:hypothetical protein [Pandoraea anapnoica]VVE76428.1 hypothetical protein PAN31117_05394 [Pandoraea anapnoica]
MSKLLDFRLHYADPTYDRVNNPQRRSIATLLPISVSWRTASRDVKIAFSGNGIACPLKDEGGVAIIENPFDRCRNKAYVLNVDGTMRCVLEKPIDVGPDAVFSDVYYVNEILCFFLSGSSGDRRIEYDVTTGTVVNLFQTR